MSETKPEEEVATTKQSNEGVYTSPLPASLNETAEESSLDVAVHAEPEKTETSSPATSDDGTLKGVALLKSLLSVPPASSVAAAAEKMITTTEVTDEKLNLRKILYQPDKTAKEEKLPESPTLNGSQANISSDAQNDDDDQRLIIDISDEERDGTAETKSMPSLGTLAEDDNSGTRRLARPTTLEMKTFAPTKHYARGVSENLLPESITYSLESSPVTGISSNVKIDILAPTASFIEVPTTTDKGSRLTNGHSSKCTKMTSLDELNVISREIDKQITKKTNKILELLKEFLCGMSDKNSFHTQMIDASDTSLSDLLLIAKKLIKRHKFESNPNHKEFMRIKFLNFPTTSNDLVVYFDNLLPSLNRDKFLSMIKFYEIIIKEMLNLNKTKILQHLIDFMVVRKNPQLDLLNYNFQVTSSPNLKLPSTPTTKFQLPDSTQTLVERRKPRHHDTSYNFIVRSNPIYLQANSSFVTSHRNVITCRMSPRIQQRSFERRPFDNNVLKGRRIGRRLTRSPEGEKVHMDLLRGRYPPTPQSENGTPTQQKTIMTSTSIVLDADTPPPSLPSEPPSPPHHKIVKAPHQQTILPDASHLDLSTTMKPRDESKVDSPRDYLPTTFDCEVQKSSLKRQSSIRASDLEILESFSNDPLKNGQITVHEIQTLNQNGTEIIPTSILKNTIMSYRPAVEVDRAHLTISSHESEKTKQMMPRGLSHEDQPIRPALQAAPKILKRRQSCHERLMLPTKENEDMAIASSAIGRNYMKFLHMYEREIKQKDRLEQRQSHQIQYPQQLHQQHHQHQQQQLHAQHKRVRFLADVEGEAQPNPRQPPSIHHSLVQQQQQHHLQIEHNRQRLLHQQQQQQQQQHQQHQQQQHQQHQQQQQQQQQQQHQQQQQQLQANQRSPIRSPIKPHAPPINYQFYEHQFEREFRERGFDHRNLEAHQANRPLELVSHIPPERYHQHEHQRAAQFANHTPQKLTQHVIEKSPRAQPRNGPVNEHHAAMMAAAYHQLQSLHRDPSSLSPQQYAEQLKQMEHLKHYQPSAFQAYQRSHQIEEQQRPLPEYYRNTQEHHQQPQQQPQLARSPPPPQYQISSSSSREDSPNGFEIHQEQSLQRKLKNKTKSLKYVEPNQIAKPFYNPAHSTYFSEPFALTKNKANATTSPPTAFQSGEPPRPRSPLPRNQDYWYAEAKAQVQNLAMQNQPQRPIPRPPVPAFESSIPARPIHFEEQPTEFLRNYYAKNNIHS